MKQFWAGAMALLLAALLAGCGPTLFDGSRTGNDSELVMEYEVLNKTDSQLLALRAGDVLDVVVVSTAGRVDIALERSDGVVLYGQKNVPTGAFHLEVPENGQYECVVTGHNAKGSVSVTKA